MKYHILNGDSLAEKFPSGEIEGKLIVMREAFVEGPVSTELTPEYWSKRADFIATRYGAEKEDYEAQFMTQLEMFDTIQDGDEVFLWFEDDLFCIANMLFAVYYLSKRTQAILYRIFPAADNKRWNGFGNAGKNELLAFYRQSHIMPGEDIELACQLWEAYSGNDREKLKALSYSDTISFRYLPDVIKAHIERTPGDGSLGRPHQTLIEILDAGKSNFYEIYDEFWKKDAIYGFGDMQVYNMLKEMEVEFEGEL